MSIRSIANSPGQKALSLRGPDSPISALHSMKSFLLTCCLGLQSHVSLQVWCGDVLELVPGALLLVVGVPPCSEERDSLPGRRSSQLKESTCKSVPVSSVNGEGGCRGRARRAGKCVCCSF